MLHLNVERYAFRTDQAHVIGPRGEIRLPRQRFNQLPFAALDLVRRGRRGLELKHAANHVEVYSWITWGKIMAKEYSAARAAFSGSKPTCPFKTVDCNHVRQSRR